MKAAILALTFLAAVSIVGCSSQNAEFEKAKAEADAAKTELAKVKTEADAAKAESALLKAQLGGKSSPNAEEAVRNAVKDFFLDLNQGRIRSAYDSMSVAYKMRMERKAFDQFIEKHPALRNVAMISTFGQPEFHPIKIRKLAKDNVHESDCSSTDLGKIVNTTPRLVQEDGAWKVDDFVEIK